MQNKKDCLEIINQLIDEFDCECEDAKYDALYANCMETVKSSAKRHDKFSEYSELLSVVKIWFEKGKK